MASGGAACDTGRKLIISLTVVAMSLLSRLNAKYGRYAVPNLTIALIVGQVLIYVAAQLNLGQDGANLLDRIQMYPDKVLAGEYWRLITFLFTPPQTNVIFAFFFFYLFYLMGTTLEVTWGAFRYNLFLAIGYVASLAFAFGAYFALGAEMGNMSASSAFLYGTVFLAFARFYPDFTLLLAFVLPVKIKWLAMFQWIVYGATFLFGDWMARAMVAAAVANYLLFFGFDIWRNLKQGHRRMQHQAKALKSTPRLVHTCTTCGITSDTAPQTQFRYCSKCDGECCYCQEHLRDHVHIARQVAEAAGGKAD